MWPWDDDEGPFVFHFWFTCSCGTEWNEFRQLKCRDDAENQVGMCVECFSEEPVEPCEFEEVEDD
jgi:hypothetical protein